MQYSRLSPHFLLCHLTLDTPINVFLPIYRTHPSLILREHMTRMLITPSILLSIRPFSPFRS